MTALRRGCQFAVVLTLLIGGLTLPRLSFDNNLLSLFPDAGGRSAEARASDELARRFEREALLLLGADAVESVHRHLPELVERLRQCECFSEVSARPMTDQPASLLDSLPGNAAPLLLTPQWRAYLSQSTAGEIAQDGLRRLLTRPDGISAQTLASDPLGTLEDFRVGSRPDTRALSLDSAGYPSLAIDDKRFVLLRLQLSDSPYGVRVQAQVKDALDAALSPLRALSGFELIKTGALFYTMAGTEQAKREISTVGLGSAIGVTVLLLLVFRSPMLLLLAFAPIALGVLGGVTANYWLFGQVHVMALVFGAALVGVSIDYSLHAFCKRLEAGPAWQSDAGFARLTAPLSLGMMTSVVGYLSFTATGFPGFIQIAILSAAGLVAAYTCVLGFYPYWLSRPPHVSIPAGLSAAIARVRVYQFRLLRFMARPAVAIALSLIVIAGLSQWRVEDDIRRMQSAPESLQQMEQTFRQSVGNRRALQYLLVSASNGEQLLRRLETLEPALQKAVAESQLGDFRALNHYLPSFERQSTNALLWQQSVIESGALEQLLQALGVRKPVKEKIQQTLSGASAVPVDRVFSDPNPAPTKPVTFSLNNRVYTVVTLYNPVEPAPLKQLAHNRDYIQWVDPVARTNQLLHEYRHNAGLLLLLAYVGIGVLVSFRYGIAGAVRVVAPPAMASVAALSLWLWSGQAISVFHMMALLLVLGIGVDYTLFLREQTDRGQATLLAIGLSTVTTVLSFGLLALSATHAIHSFGATVWVGIVLAFVLAPLAAKDKNGFEV